MIYGIAFLLDPNFCSVNPCFSCSNLSFCRSIHLFLAEKSTILTWEDTPSSPFQGFPQGFPYILQISPGFSPGFPQVLHEFFGLSKVSVFTQLQPNPSASSLLMIMGLVLLGHGKIMGKSWENHGKFSYKWRFQWEKSWENHKNGGLLGKSSNYC